MSVAVELRAVGVRYSDQDQPTLEGVDLRIEHGELVLVVGRTGSGKSTLLGVLNGLVPHLTGGHLTGEVLIHGRSTRTHRPRDLADLIGYVGQDPLAGFVADTVEEELAYSMEQLGLAPEVMRRRVEETMDLLGIAELRDRPLADLSGGQQQRVAIGAALTAHPRVLVLDEPTSALDPTGAEEVLAAITRLVHDLALTVIVAEHRVERVLQYADRVVLVDQGRACAGPPQEMMRASQVAPPVVELGRWAGWDPLPMSVRDAWRAAAPWRAELDQRPGADSGNDAAFARTRGDRPVLSARGVIVQHGAQVAVAEADLELFGGEVVALTGRNGAGKSSLLWAMQGSGPRRSGRVLVEEHGQTLDTRDLAPARRRRLVGLVPQTPSDLLYLPTVAAECQQADRESGGLPGRCAAMLAGLAPGIDPGLHPRDLSEGQRLALVLAIQLTADPTVLLLDEPTRGLDYPGKQALAAVLRQLAAEGRSVLLSTHDVEFVAQVADRVLLMAAGELVGDAPTADALAISPAFAPQIAKALGHGVLTVAEVQRRFPHWSAAPSDRVPQRPATTAEEVAR